MNNYKQDFPIFLKSGINNLHYLDSAATTQKPQVVIDAITQYYEHDCANVHRGIHELGERSTRAWEEARKKIAIFFGAHAQELILTRNTTEALNGVALGLDSRHVRANDLIVTTIMEHHSNFVPWQQLAKKTQAQFLTININKNGQLMLDQIKNIFSQHHGKIKIFALTHVSNVLGTINPIHQISQIVRKYSPDCLIVLDSAQAVAHIPINFHDLDVDFLAFSGHKLYGPMGIGGLLVKKNILNQEKLNPWLFGGGMIDEVSVTNTTFSSDLNDKFTAGTPDVASAVGLAASIEYLTEIGWRKIREHEFNLLNQLLKKLSTIAELKLLQPIDLTNKIGSVSFIYESVHAHDVSQVLSSENVAVRSGHHCCMPLHTHLGLPSTIRASLGIYNTEEDIEALMNGLKKVKSIFNQI